MTTSRIVTLSALCAAVLATQAVAQTPKRGGSLTLSASGGEPANLDCASSPGSGLVQFTAPIYSKLLRYDVVNYPNIVGDLAESWTTAPDGLSYTFKLRPNVQFHDGTPVTSADVKATYERFRNPPQPNIAGHKETLASIVGIDTPDPLTVTFRVAERDYSIFTTFAGQFMCIYSARKLAAEPNYPSTSPMGSGAFVFDGYQRGQSWSGKRFEGYFLQGRPYLDSYKYVVMTGPADVNAASAGQIDLLPRVLSPQEVETITRGLGDKVAVKNVILNTSVYMRFNAQRKPFDDVRVRRALSLAIDRWTGIEPMRKITNMDAVGGLLIPGSQWAFTDAELAQIPGFGKDVNANRAEARKLLAEAGQSQLKFVISTVNRANPYINVSLFAANEWRQIGVTTEMKTYETSAELFSAGLRGDYDVSYDANTAPGYDPTQVLTRFVPRQLRNYGHYDDQILDDLYAKQRIITNDAERKPLLDQFQRRMIDQAYVAPMFWGGWAMPIPRTIHGWQPSADYYGGYDFINVWRD